MPVPAAAVTVILPCLNEALALPSVLSRISSSYQVIVVDNGSTDGSRKVAAEYGARVLLEPCLGYGAAVHTGVRAAVTDLVCILDADGSIDPAVLPRLIEPLNAGEADLVIGRRRPTTYGAFPLHARWANAAVAARLRHCTSLRVRDLGCGARMSATGIARTGRARPAVRLSRGAARPRRARRLDSRRNRRALRTAHRGYPF
jgi:dTDP-L-rhamnose 4-epimerase